MTASALQPYWDQILANWNQVWSRYAPVVGLPDSQSEHIMFAIFCTVALSGTYYALNLILYFVYHFDIFPQYKIAPSVWPDRRLVIKTLSQVIPGHIFVRPIVFYTLYPWFKWHGMPSAFAPVPSAMAILGQFALNIVLNDTLFYWVHRGLHHRSIYKHVHKKHHEWKVNLGIAVEYCHPIEELISNGFPTLAGCLFFGAHPAVICLWLVFRMTETVDAHSGFEFPWSPFHMFPSIQGGASRHDYHHSHNVGNYGSFFVFWDWLCGTDKSYNEWMKKKKSSKSA